jgi:hypothetical protein
VPAENAVGPEEQDGFVQPVARAFGQRSEAKNKNGEDGFLPLRDTRCLGTGEFALQDTELVAQKEYFDVLLTVG